MAPPTPCKMPLVLLLAVSLLIPSALAGVICEDLPQDKCAFAVSSSSKRCVLESYQRSGAPTEYKCRSSEVGVSRIQDHIETEECVTACGVDRSSVGISSDLLLETQFQDKLCSPECFQNCPNIIDLYYNLAAGEGVFLPSLCEARKSDPHRAMTELASSGAAPGPAASPKKNELGAASPASAPAASPKGNKTGASPAPAPVYF